MALLPGTHIGKANFGLAGLAGSERRPPSVLRLWCKGQSSSLSPEDQDRAEGSGVSLPPRGWHAFCFLPCSWKVPQLLKELSPPCGMILQSC